MSEFKKVIINGGSAGVAEVVKGAGLKIRSRMGSWVRIPPPAPPFRHFFMRFETAFDEAFHPKPFNTPQYTKNR